MENLVDITRIGCPGLSSKIKRGAINIKTHAGVEQTTLEATTPTPHGLR